MALAEFAVELANRPVVLGDAAARLAKRAVTLAGSAVTLAEVVGKPAGLEAFTAAPSDKAVQAALTARPLSMLETLLVEAEGVIVVMAALLGD